MPEPVPADLRDRFTFTPNTIAIDAHRQPRNRTSAWFDPAQMKLLEVLVALDGAQLPSKALTEAYGWRDNTVHENITRIRDWLTGYSRRDAPIALLRSHDRLWLTAIPTPVHLPVAVTPELKWALYLTSDRLSDAATKLLETVLALDAPRVSRTAAAQEVAGWLADEPVANFRCALVRGQFVWDAVDEVRRIGLWTLGVRSGHNWSRPEHPLAPTRRELCARLASNLGRPVLEAGDVISDVKALRKALPGLRIDAWRGGYLSLAVNEPAPPEHPLALQAGVSSDGARLLGLRAAAAMRSLPNDASTVIEVGQESPLAGAWTASWRGRVLLVEHADRDLAFETAPLS